MFKEMVSCLSTVFLFGVGSTEGEEDGATPDDDGDDDGVSVSRGGMFSTESVASPEDELAPPKNSFSFPEVQLFRCVSLIVILEYTRNAVILNYPVGNCVRNRNKTRF